MYLTLCWHCCTLSSENLGMFKSLEKHVSGAWTQHFTWSKTKCFIVRFQTSSTWRKCRQIKPGCWVAHLFTIALMEHSAMRLAGGFLLLRIIIAPCWKGWLSWAGISGSDWIMSLMVTYLLTGVKLSAYSNGLLYWYQWNINDSNQNGLIQLQPHVRTD